MSLSISDEINAAIKSHHTALNRLTLHLLPFALPPYASSPQIYARGIAHFLPIYSAFETPLRSLYALALTHHLNTGVHRLYIPTLERSSSLEYDLRHLPQWLHQRRLESRPLHSSNEEDAEPTYSYSADSRPRLSNFLTHISTTVVAKPHVLLAYTWIFYMALFSGGRYIRGKLHGVEEEGFWVQGPNARPASGAVTVIPLSFWDFPTDTHDGEDLKIEFKTRVQTIESSLSPAQRKDITDEAIEIMMQLLEIVREIDSSMREENSHRNENPVVLPMILSHEKPQDVEELPDKEELVFLMKLLYLSLGGAAEVLIRIRSFFSFAPAEPRLVPVHPNC